MLWHKNCDYVKYWNSLAKLTIFVMFNNKKKARNMKNIIYLIRKMPLIAILALLLLVSSCGSYQYVGVANDGIYGDTPRTISPTQDVATNVPNGSNDYYQNYFKSKA